MTLQTESAVNTGDVAVVPREKAASFLGALRVPVSCRWVTAPFALAYSLMFSRFVKINAVICVAGTGVNGGC